METGKAVKLIRTLKGYTQKEVYSGIISRSFVNLFEQGTHDISSSKLFKVINNLSISPNEFQFVLNNYNPSVINKYLMLINNLYNQKSFVALSKWINEQKSKKTKNEKLTIAIGYAEVLLLTYDHKQIYTTPYINHLLLYVQKARLWTLEEIKMARMLIPVILTSKDRNMELDKLISKMEYSCKKYINNNDDFFNVENRLVNFYGVLLQNYFNYQNFIMAKKIIYKLNAINKRLLSWEGMLELNFWKLIWGMYFDNFQKSKKKIELMIMVSDDFSISFKSTIQDIYKIRSIDAHKYRVEISKDK